MEEGARCLVKIEDLGHAGEGVGRIDGLVVFVPGVLPGEEVEVEITQVSRKHARGIPVSILTRSPQRVEPECELHGLCGGCQLQHLNYPSQLAYKEKLVANALKRIGGLDVPVLPIVPAPSPWNYRTKIQSPVGVKGKEIVTGFFARGTHDIVPMESCLIQHPLNNLVLRTIRGLVIKYGIIAYDESSGQGDLRHVIVRIGESQALVTLVTRQEQVPHLRELAQELTETLPSVVGVVQNINPARTNVILGPKTIPLAGQDYLIVSLDGIEFKVSPMAFLQVNWEQTKNLYRIVREFAQLSGHERLVDAYCGIGTIALYLAPWAGEVYGIEEVPEAVEDAIFNSTLNNLPATFICGLVEEELARLAKEGPIDVLVMDPPRKGCHPRVIETIRSASINRIVYVSCNPGTLARDLGMLKEYEILAVQPVDMFPQTHHVECVVLITRVKD
ncbi:MAG: 23S rRNA (uracil(1939)-C(5))-methyltransferase RlmD [Firmicutes bacterium]|nr:23S rRNA (uracil(1939)-C(5))-methyltransferase RlmD [Bacillota bacterium]